MTAVLAPIAFLDFGLGELFVVGLVALLLFGGSLPERMRTLGAAYRSFRRSLEDLQRQALSPDPPPRRPPYPSTPPPSDVAARSTPPASASAPAPVGPPRQRVDVGVPSDSTKYSAPAPWAPPASPPPSPRVDDDLPLV